MGKKLTTEEYNEQIKSIGWEAIEEYQGVSVKIKHRCLKCHNIREYLPNKVKTNKPKCYCCGGRRTKEEDLRFIKERCNELGYKIIDFGVTKGHKYFTYICPHHPNEIKKMNFHDFLVRKCVCRECSNENQMISKEEAFNRANKIIPDNIFISDVYRKNDRWMIETTCKKHHTTKTTKLNLFYKLSHFCNDCANESTGKKLTLPKQQAIEDFKKQLKSTEKLIDVYRKGYWWFAKIECNQHGIFEISKANHKKGKGCPKCSSSRGETKIREFLSLNDIIFEEQYRFKNCKNINSLPFDFYIPSLNLAIEYQGEQHYKPVDYFGGEKQFEIQQRNDNIKRKYCKNNNIKLLEIPYTEYDNVEEILKKELSI